MTRSLATIDSLIEGGTDEARADSSPVCPVSDCQRRRPPGAYRGHSDRRVLARDV